MFFLFTASPSPVLCVCPSFLLTLQQLYSGTGTGKYHSKSGKLKYEYIYQVNYQQLAK